MRAFVEQIEKTIGASPIVLSSHVERHYGPSDDTLYLRGTVHFIDATVMDFSLFVMRGPRGIIVDKYRFQYMTKSGRMIFRYDNAPHHPALSSFPHHKHISSDKAVPSTMPSIKDLLNEISAMILTGKS
ncbi:MAG: DUF6516 family protein [Nitrospirota bacterium]|nr:DUF6516 family protein [Nitrospirota bacterium]